ncbi:MAG TPA: ATP-grasp domain-containing protein [Nocardioidaceae bacterium]|nr:ATP-grasp domain-containing protein [Nocardioidaceae bacterium]
MTDVLLATCSGLPEGEAGGHLLVDELAARGLGASWVCWDDEDVDWGGARLVVVRSTWDYEWRREEFLAWARKVESLARLVNSSRVLEWNTDKVYLLGLLEAGLRVVPTLAAEEEGELHPAIAAFDAAVVKPRVGAGGRGVVVFDGVPGGPEALDESQLDVGPWIVQPLVESVRTEGETSVFVLGGRGVSQVCKRPAGGDIRVHEEYGGRTQAVTLTEEARTLAEHVVAEVERLLDVELPYARVDLMRMPDGELVLSELEVAEPGLYLDHVPENAAAFADVVAGLMPEAGDQGPGH